MFENQQTEWKAKWKDEYLEWVCAFANAQGGKLYIGVDDNGNVLGLSNVRKLLEDIPNKIRDAMGIVVSVDVLNKDGKDYLEISVPPYPIPVSCKGAYYIRCGSTKQTLSGPELEAFILRKRGISWDNMPMPLFRENDIDTGVIKKFIKWAEAKGRIETEGLANISKMELMEKLHLVKDNYLTNAAMLLFSNDPERLQLGAYIKIGFFANDADLLYQDEIRGSLLDQVEKTIELVYLKYMKARITYNGVQRKERYFLPLEAFREALLNAVCHKQYESGVPVQISVYDRKLYIANCGSLPFSWTAENLLGKHVSKPYNPNIAHVFYLAGFIESWGRGIEKISVACKNDGVPQPKFTIHPQDIMIEFEAPDDWSIGNIDSKDDTDVVDNVVDNVVDGLADIDKKVLLIMKKNRTVIIADIAKKLNVTKRTIDRSIRDLKNMGILERIGTSRNGYWKINKK